MLLDGALFGEVIVSGSIRFTVYYYLADCSNVTCEPAYNGLSCDINRLEVSGVRWLGVAVFGYGPKPLPVYCTLFRCTPEVLKYECIMAGLIKPGFTHGPGLETPMGPQILLRSRLYLLFHKLVNVSCILQFVSGWKICKGRRDCYQVSFAFRQAPVTDWQYRSARQFGQACSDGEGSCRYTHKGCKDSMSAAKILIRRIPADSVIF